MKWLAVVGFSCALVACASDPIYRAPPVDEVSDFVAAHQLKEADLIRKGNSDIWQYVNDRYVIYKGPRNYLVEFRKNCGELDNNSWVPADYIHDHRNLTRECCPTHHSMNLRQLL